MARFGFVGGSYQSQALSADAQMTMNLLAEKDDSGSGKSDVILVSAPGLSLPVYQLGDEPIRGIWNVSIPNSAEKVFAVSGSSLFELFSDGTSANRGALANDGRPASLASSNIQLMIASGGQGYCLTFATNVLTGPIAQISGVTQVGYTDGYFVACIGNTAQIYVSNLLDGTTWSGGQTAIVSVFPDNIVSMIVDHREVCLLGQKQSQCYYDSGNTFPYDVIPGAFAEDGSAATFGAVKADNTVFWIDKDERGNGVAKRAQGYTPQRISTHAVENAWQKYTTISDAEAYACQLKGHTLVVWYFPSANKTWVYDVASGLWFEWGFWDAAHGAYTAHRSRCHVFAFGKHLVGDWATGNIYQMDFPKSDGAGGWLFCSDFGNLKRWVRRSPYVGVAGVWNYFNSLEFIMGVGVGPSPDLLTGGGYDSTEITSSGGSDVVKIQRRVLASTTLGHQYTISGTFKNLGATTVTITFLMGAASQTATIAPGASAVVSLGPLTSDGGAIFYKISTQNASDSLNLIGYNPSSFDTANPSTDLLAALTLKQFSTGWLAIGGATITLSQNNPNPLSSPRDPQVTLRWSNDGANTWTGDRDLSIGRVGKYKTRVIARRLGRAWGSFGRIFELSGSDPVPIYIVDADINADPAMKPQKRLAQEIRERA